MKSTIIKIQYKNYSENVTVNNDKRASELRGIIKNDKEFVSYSIVAQGDYEFFEAERVEKYISLNIKIGAAEERLETGKLEEDESYRELRNTIIWMYKQRDKIYLRKRDKDAIESYYMCGDMF